MLTEHPWNHVDTFDDLLKEEFHNDNSIGIRSEHCIVWLDHNGDRWYLVSDTTRSEEKTEELQAKLKIINDQRTAMKKTQMYWNHFLGKY